MPLDRMHHFCNIAAKMYIQPESNQEKASDKPKFPGNGNIMMGKTDIVSILTEFIYSLVVKGRHSTNRPTK